MAMNTSYLNTAGSPTGMSDMSTVAGSVQTFGSIAGTVIGAIGSASAVSGAAGTFTTIGGTIITPSVQLDNSSASFLIKQGAGTSITSLTVGNGELSILSLSAGSATLAFRSGNTVYSFIADQANL